MIDPRVEELLEQLFVAQVEEGQEASGPLDEQALSLAEEMKLLEVTGGKCRLSAGGLIAARDVIRRHRLAECLLRDVLGVNVASLDADACEFEHIIQHGLDEKICSVLGHPSKCPHGNAIPPGDCCGRAQADQVREVSPLSEGPTDVDGTVVYLQTRDHREVQKLMALGILPGVQIRLLQRFPSYVFQLGYSQFTVDQTLAQKIHVRWNTRPDSLK